MGEGRSIQGKAEKSHRGRWGADGLRGTAQSHFWRPGRCSLGKFDGCKSNLNLFLHLTERGFGGF